MISNIIFTGLFISSIFYKYIKGKRYKIKEVNKHCNCNNCQILKKYSNKNYKNNNNYKNYKLYEVKGR